MRALLLLSLFGLSAPQGPRELWTQGERAQAITALSAELEERESPAARRQLVEWCFTVHRYRAALEAAAALGEAGDSLKGRALYFLGRYEESLALLDEGAGEAVLMLSLIHIPEPTRRYAISYAVFCLKKKNTQK